MLILPWLGGTKHPCSETLKGFGLSKELLRSQAIEYNRWRATIGLEPNVGVGS